MSHLATDWERVNISSSTRKHLKLGFDHVWTRMFDGFAEFLVLNPRHQPGWASRGYNSLDAALQNRGLR